MTAEPLPPGAVIGILGGGQLGRMLALAAARLGLRCHIYSDRADDCAFDVVGRRTVAPYEDRAALAAFAQACSVVTFEFENVPRAALDICAAQALVFPPPTALEATQDRLLEKNFLVEQGIAVGPYRPVGTAPELMGALGEIGTPALLKTRRFGYDGKGQARIESAEGAAEVLAGFEGRAVLLEAVIQFAREISVIAVRARSGQLAFYDPVENVHANGMLATSTVPAALSAAEAEAAIGIAGRIAEALGHVGVLAVEMFHVGPDAEQPFLINEIAPRVHNSGHWTIDACMVSQFENHIRAVAGWPLGPTARHSDAVMTNLIGWEAERWRAQAAEPSALHIYGKGTPQPGRKMGHVTRITPLRSDLDAR